MRAVKSPAAVLLEEFLAHSFQFREGVLVVGSVGGGDAFVDAGEGGFGAACLEEGLGGHLIGGDVVGVVGDEGVEFGESCFDVGVGDVFHGEAVASEGVGGVELKDFVEGCYLAHALMVAGVVGIGKLGGAGIIGWSGNGRERSCFARCPP